jgi:hypothetical protein
MMRYWLGAILVAGGVILSTGCATTNNDENVSSIPWNRPQSWEGQGALGGMRPPGSN